MMLFPKTSRCRFSLLAGLVCTIGAGCGRTATPVPSMPREDAPSAPLQDEARTPDTAGSIPAPAGATAVSAGDRPRAAGDHAARAKAPAAPMAAPPAEEPEPPQGATVLHIGDSFAGALGIELNRRFKEHGVRGILRFETSSYIPTWASEPKLASYLTRYDPDLVLVTLGANELQVVDPTIRIRTIEKLVKRLGGRPCVWVGVPLWQGARGALLDVIRDHCAPCVYMDSNRLFPDMPRARDGIHPSMPAREEWSRRVLDWLSAHRGADDDHVWAIEP